MGPTLRMPDDADAFGAGCPENPVDHPGKGRALERMPPAKAAHSTGRQFTTGGLSLNVHTQGPSFARLGANFDQVA